MPIKEKINKEKIKEKKGKLLVINFKSCNFQESWKSKYLLLL